MSKSSKATEKVVATQIEPFDNFLGNFVNELDNAIRTWSTSPKLTSLFESNGVRVPLCEIQDKGHGYELHVEIPGMGKETVKVSGQPHSVEISAERSNLTNRRSGGRIYTERSASSFYRQIPFPEEIAPQKIRSTVKDGVLVVMIPKKSAVIKSGRQAKSSR
jgi:HSP20 family protein